MRMKKLLQQLGGGALVLALSLNFTGIAWAVDPVFPWTNNWSFSDYLRNTQGGQIRVKSTIRVTAVTGPIYKLSYATRLENIPADTRSQKVYQAWLIDSDTGWRLSIGSTIRKKNGTGDMSFTQYFANPKIFDKLEITEEELFDQSPAPSETIVYSADLTIPAFTELGYKTSFSPKNLVPAMPNSNKGGSGKFIINLKNNTIKYRLDIRNISSANRMITLYGPARPGANGPKVQQLEAGSTNVLYGEISYDQSREEKLMAGEYYLVISTEENPEQGIARGQIVF